MLDPLYSVHEDEGNDEDYEAAIRMDKAVRAGDAETVEALLKGGARSATPMPNWRGNDALHVSAELGNTAVMKLLLASDWDINARERTNQHTPLHLAVLHNHVDAVQLLLEKDALASARDTNGETPLHCAIQSLKGAGRLDMARLLLRHGADVEAVNDRGLTPLLLAIEHRNYKMVKLLLTDGAANVNGSGDPARIPLYAALSSQHSPMALLLLDNGAKVDLLNEYNASPLHVAMQCIFNPMLFKVCHRLLEHGAERWLNHRTYCWFDKETSSFTGTPLIYAVGCMSLPLVELFIARGADVNLINQDETTPLYHAVVAGAVDVAKRILDADVDMVHRYHGGSLLDIAIMKNNEMFELLVKYGVNCNDNEAVIRAAGYGRVETMKALLSGGANVNAEFPVNGNRRFSALTYAVDCGHRAMVQYLLENGADVNLEVEGYLPLTVVPSHFVNFNTSVKSTVCLVLKQIAILVAQDLYVHDANVRSIQGNAFMREAYESYRRELERMQSARVCDDASVTHFDLVAKRNDALVRCLRSEGIRSQLPSVNRDTRFPEYANLRYRNCAKGLRRLEMMANLQSLLHTLFISFMPLFPCDITVKISEYFRDSDLELYFQELS